MEDAKNAINAEIVLDTKAFTAYCKGHPNGLFNLDLGNATINFALLGKLHNLSMKVEDEKYFTSFFIKWFGKETINAVIDGQHSGKNMTVTRMVISEHLSIFDAIMFKFFHYLKKEGWFPQAETLQENK